MSMVILYRYRESDPLQADRHGVRLVLRSAQPPGRPSVGRSSNPGTGERKPPASFAVPA